MRKENYSKAKEASFLSDDLKTLNLGSYRRDKPIAKPTLADLLLWLRIAKGERDPRRLLFYSFLIGLGLMSPKQTEEKVKKNK